MISHRDAIWTGPSWAESGAACLRRTDVEHVRWSPDHPGEDSYCMDSCVEVGKWQCQLILGRWFAAR